MEKSQKLNLDYNFYEYLLKKNTGLLEIGVKLPIKDIKALSLVYSPGVASSCKEIHENIENSYKYTNKINTMLLVTDSSAGNFKRSSWNDQAPIPYLEAICCMYKKLANIDCYPLIIKKNEIKNGEELADLITKIMPAYSCIEFYNMDEQLIKQYYEARFNIEKNLYNEKILKQKRNTSEFRSYLYSSYSSVDKQVEQSKLSKNYTELNINMIYAAAVRASLDTQSYFNLDDLINKLKQYALSKLNNESIQRVYSTMHKLISYAYEYLEDIAKNNSNIELYKEYNTINYNINKYYVNEYQMNKEYILTKYHKFITEGEFGWVCNFPPEYSSNKLSLDDNSLLLHKRHKGVVSPKLKMPFQSIEEMMKLLNFDNLEHITKKIIDNPKIAKELTTHGNLGAIITNGTAILGLGNIGALAGLPVMEGKSVIFKLFGGVDIVPFCIDENDPKKFVRICELISPIYSIVNLEDIKSPECFYIEPALDEKVDFPIFHDDQHGTAIVCLAGLINSCKILNKKISDVKVVMNGAGAAGLSVAELLIAYGVKDFIVCDTVGAIYEGRSKNMNEFKNKMASITNKSKKQGSLSDVVKETDVFIGLSVGGALSKDMVKSMNKDPIIFALANPTPEIFPEEAYEAGAAIVATGRSDYPNQINNSMAFPGIFRAAIDIGAKRINMLMKIAASEGIADSIKDELRKDRIVPNSMETIVAVTVAKAVAKSAEKEGLIRRKNIDCNFVEENIDSWFHEGKLRVKLDKKAEAKF